MTTRARNPDHPILREAWKHEVVGFHYDGLAEEPYLDLVLRHAETKVIRRLRFFSPTEISISGPHMNWGLAIADVRQRQMERIGVEVYNFENSQGPAEFYARDVADVSESER
jgi:hypothetical protein